ncbi:V-type proton ATPase subunit G 1-like [Mesoplodon densirostris]|uniref:V-type proton ATPase subunit G 1-like n=1 Tax=Mesoplodon densirostris TaxID=48708 RepID=UPI0028DC4341|nr:V-type proton ATPase subunit G 1-like [Mesoplodon densirostris]
MTDIRSKQNIHENWSRVLFLGERIQMHRGTPHIEWSSAARPPGLVPSPHQALPCARSWLHPEDRVGKQAKSASSHSVTLGEDTDDKKETSGSGSDWWFKENEAPCGDRGRSQGIQQLLQAEKRAAKEVAEDHKQKNWRLKQAKAAAWAEIEQYRPQREKEFKAKEAAALGSHGSCSTEADDPQEKVTILQTYFRQNRDEVRDKLLAFVCDIQPEIHKNYHKNG